MQQKPSQAQIFLHHPTPSVTHFKQINVRNTYTDRWPVFFNPTISIC